MGQHGGCSGGGGGGHGSGGVVPQSSVKSELNKTEDDIYDMSTMGLTVGAAAFAKDLDYMTHATRPRPRRHIK